MITRKEAYEQAMKNNVLHQVEEQIKAVAGAGKTSTTYVLTQTQHDEVVPVLAKVGYEVITMQCNGCPIILINWGATSFWQV
jgi:dihydrodipicolinate synthase/N-acetylneuraminate lyase